MSGEAPEVNFVAAAQTIDVGGVALELIVKGNGSPLLFLHGMDGVEKAASLIDLLAETHTVYAPSHPGFGASSLPGTITTVDDLSYFYLDLLEHLNLRNAAIAGFSIGGWLAAEILSKDAGRASHLVLGAPLGLPTGNRQTQRVTDIFMLDPRQAQSCMQVTPVPSMPPASMPEAALTRMVRNAEAVAVFGWSPYLCNPKLKSRLHRIKLPTHILWGEDDRIAPLDYGKDYAAALPGASFEVLAKCGHRIHVDQPDAAAKSIRQFVKNSAAVAA